MITFVNVPDGDWSAMYVGDRRVMQGHSLDPIDVGYALLRAKLPHTEPFQRGTIDHDCLEEHGWEMPERLDDVVFWAEDPLESWEP